MLIMIAMRFSVVFCLFICFMHENASVMASCSIDDVLQPSDLFGKEILPECTFESEYGILKFHSVVVPDFSDNEECFKDFAKCFGSIKNFMKENDLSKKHEISSYIPFCITPLASIPYKYANEAYNFAKRITANFACRFFENGVSLSWDIYSVFCPSVINFIELNHDILLYNNSPISEALSYGTSQYILAIVQIKASSDERSNMPFIKASKIINEVSASCPTHNYLSWALYRASSNKSLLNSYYECNK